jgi:hypothetical protein
VIRLLRHLERKGFRYSPRHLSVDGRGRDVLSLLFAYMAWHFTPLHPELMGDGTTGHPLADRPRRLRLMADTYGLTPDERKALLSEVAGMEVRQAARIADDAQDGDQVSARLWRAGRFTENTARSLSWLAEQREGLERELRLGASSPPAGHDRASS